MVTLRLYDNTVSPVQVIPLTLEDEDAYCIHKFNGDDTLNFEIQRNRPIYSKILEETKIQGFNNRFIVKKIDEHSDFVVVDCELDYEDWKKIIFKNYRRTNVSLDDVLEEIKPSGWNITYGVGVNLTRRTTVEESEGQEFRAAIALEILNTLMDTYDVVFNFDILNKVLSVKNPSLFITSGEFIMEDLNLTDLGFNGDSSNLITRLYPYGKKDESTGKYLTIKSVNNDFEYIENHQYSNRIVSGTWVDERYTIAGNLYVAAIEKLAELSRPQRSYTCNVINFNEDIWLYKIITLIDKNKDYREEHQVVEFIEYNNHKLDKCTLSSKPPSIVEIVSETTKDFKENIKKEVGGIQALIESETARLSKMITGSHGGHFKWIYNADGDPEELVNLYDTDDITTAQSVWRWNAGGLGHSNNGYNGTYDIALGRDGSINASMITTGILNAGLIRAGTLQGGGTTSNPNFKLIMDTGELTMKHGTINLGNKFIVNDSGTLFLEKSTTGKERVVIKQALIKGQARNSTGIAWSEEEYTEGSNWVATVGTLDLCANYSNSVETVLATRTRLHLKAHKNAGIFFESQESDGTNTQLMAEMKRTGADFYVPINGTLNGKASGELHDTFYGVSRLEVYLPTSPDLSTAMHCYIKDGIVKAIDVDSL